MFEDKTVDEIRQYFKHHKGAPELVPLKKRCHDCAVTCGFYEPFAQALSRLTEKEIEYHSKRWFCHNNRQRACAGNIDYQKKIKDSTDG